MSIQVICFFYNEAALVPFFLSHYRWADEILAVTSPSDDQTEALLKSDPRVVMEEILFPDGFDDLLKTERVNEILSRPTKHGWQIVVDADEFIWSRGRLWQDDREYLAQVPDRLSFLSASLWNVWRHKDDKDLNPNSYPVVIQRCHGEKDRSWHYNKPIVLRANRGLQLEVGNHALAKGADKVATTRLGFDGAHWQNADPSFCVARRVLDRSRRLSRRNLDNGYGVQHFNLTEEQVLAECARHLNDPQVF